MNYDEVLPLACEVVGMPVIDVGIGPMVNTGFSTMLMEDPALPAYVAELLVAKVHELDDRHLQSESIEHIIWKLGEDEPFFAPARIRILAALVALEKLTLEQAKEVAS